MNDKKENKPYEHCESCEYRGNHCHVDDKFQRNSYGFEVDRKFYALAQEKMLHFPEPTP